MPAEFKYQVGLEMSEVPNFDQLEVTVLPGDPGSLFQALSLSLYSSTDRELDSRFSNFSCMHKHNFIISVSCKTFIRPFQIWESKV